MNKILIIGNCESDYIRLSKFLEKEFKTKCKPATSIFEAKKILSKDSSFSLLLVNRSGYFDRKPGTLILDYLKENSLDTPVFVLTSQKDAIKEAIKAGAKGGFSKSPADNEKSEVISLLKPYLTKK